LKEAKMTDSIPRQGKLERITRRWWFFGLFVLIQFFPPYASKGYNIEDWGKVIQHALGNAIVGQHPEIYPVFQVIAILALIGILIFRNKFARIFGIYVAISYVLFAIGQSIAITDKYGVLICTINFVMFLIVAGFWAWEAVVLKNDYTFRKLPIRRYWVVPLAILVFWYPASKGRPDFNPLLLVTSGSGLAFCLMTPVYLALLSLYWPRVNMPVMRVTSIVGIIIGLYNLPHNFAVDPGRRWWNGVLHIPLLVISLYGLILSLKRPQVKNRSDENAELDTG
jgi:hypothetical protein